MLVLLELCCRPPIDELTRDHPLSNAAVRGDAARLKALISSGADVNDGGRNGWTALHWAAHPFVQWGDRRNQASCIRMLVAHGANVNARTQLGETPLELGSWSVDCVRALLAAGAQVNMADLNGVTPLMRAAQDGSVEAVQLLLDAGADPNAQDAIGWTPLMAAVIHGPPGGVKALLHVGANVNMRDKAGKTALRRLMDAQLPGFFEQLLYPSQRRYTKQREEIAQILHAAGGIE